MIRRGGFAVRSRSGYQRASHGPAPGADGLAKVSSRCDTEPAGRTLRSVRLAGVEVRDAHALELALLLQHYGHTHTADLIGIACVSHDRDVPLDPIDKGAIIAVLEGPPTDFVDLRDVLMRELRAVWPVRAAN